MSLPKFPNLRSNLLVVFSRTCVVSVKPSDILGVYDLEHSVLGPTTSKPRQDRLCLGQVLIRVNVKIDSYWVVPKEELGDGI
jgi:hypothetical protein